MTLRIFYVDESYDTDKFCLSAIAIRHQDWVQAFEAVRQQRRDLKTQYGIFVRKEVHAHKFVAGRGQMSPRLIGKWERSRIFEQLLRRVATLPGVFIINVCLDVRGRSDPALDAWDRLANRIERTMRRFEEDEATRRKGYLLKLKPLVPDDLYSDVQARLLAFAPRAMIFADEGNELHVTRILRKMRVFNPIPSQLGAWNAGSAIKNIPVERILEDPVFKKSHQSFFIQLADCVSYALLKREVAPTPVIKRYGIHQMFDSVLAPACMKAASASDPLGIVRK